MNKSSQSKLLYDSFKKWSDKNWKESLSNQSIKIDEYIDKLSTLDIWSNQLRKTKSSKLLITELFFDSYAGLLFACQGLYKYAFICLRSQLEITFRIIYFSTHSVEYSWWSKGSQWFLEKGNHVWGKGFHSYFGKLDSIEEFNLKLPNQNMDILNNIKIIYSELSKYVHSSPHTLQSKDSKISPEYSCQQHQFWLSRASNLMNYINLFFILGFEKEFDGLSKQHKLKILDSCFNNSDFKSIIEEKFNLSVNSSKKKQTK